MPGSSVWFITGVSSGFGTHIALKALEAGCRVVGTVRSRQRAANEVRKIENKGGICLELDVTQADQCFDVVREAEKLVAPVDVLINNAGMSFLGAIADFSDEEAKAQMEVNFHGPLRLIQAVLPGMRTRKTGTIVNVTSVAGLDGVPSSGMYAASKFALEGLSEALQREVQEHNILVLLVEPGAFRTNFLSAYKTTKVSTVEHYAPVKAGFDKFESLNGTQKGDPEKAATSIVEVVAGVGSSAHLKGQILRLPLGPDCVARLEAKTSSMLSDLEKTRAVAMSTDLTD